MYGLGTRPAILLLDLIVAPILTGWLGNEANLIAATLVTLDLALTTEWFWSCEPEREEMVHRWLNTKLCQKTNGTAKSVGYKGMQL